MQKAFCGHETSLSLVPLLLFDLIKELNWILLTIWNNDYGLPI